MVNVKVKTVGAIINSQPIGSIVDMTKAEADHYAKLGYVEILPKPKPAKKVTAPKKTAKKVTEKQTKDK